jgi:hypothetical protein
MPARETVEAFVAVVEAGRYVDAIEQFYAPDASMQENGEPPRVGRETLMEGERRVMARFQSIAARRIGASAIDGDHVAIHWRFVFTPAAGEPMTLEEIAWQRWDREKVAEERFFYDPKQLGR